MKKTLLMGATPNPEKYAHLAATMLHEYGHESVLFGLHKGEIEGTEIVNELPKDKDIDTVTLYLNPQNQKNYVDYILNLHPKRVIFNPGTENPEFEDKLREKGIQALEACTLVLLRTGQF